MNLSHLLMLARVFFVPFALVFLIIKAGSAYLAGILFLAAAFVDWLDGRLRRRAKQVSPLRRLLGPLAGKLLVSAALIALVQAGRAPGWMVVLIVGKEFSVIGLRAIASSQGVSVPPIGLERIETPVEIVAAALLILSWPPGRLFPPSIGLLVLSVAMVIALISGLAALFKFWRALDPSSAAKRW